jgi:hypothetical protein
MMMKMPSRSWFAFSMVAIAVAIARPGRAQPSGDFSAGPPPEASGYETTVKALKPSPPHTQDRVFPTTRFWLLDEGRYEIQTWVTDQIYGTGMQTGITLVKLQWGVAPHLQMDVYQNFAFNEHGWQGVEGNQIELRYALASYNVLPLNPVIYLQWHPRVTQPDRGMIRLLLGGDLGESVLWAANLYFETNIDRMPGPYKTFANANAGVTLAVSVATWRDYLRLGGEVLAGIDQHKTPQFNRALLLGPSAMLKVPEVNIKVTGTLLLGTAPKDPRIFPQLLFAKQW